MTAIAPLAAGGSAAAWSVKGGNFQLSKRLLEKENVNLRLNHTVESVKLD